MSTRPRCPRWGACWTSRGKKRERKRWLRKTASARGSCAVAGIVHHEDGWQQSPQTWDFERVRLRRSALRRASTANFDPWPPVTYIDATACSSAGPVAVSEVVTRPIPIEVQHRLVRWP